MKRGYPSDNEEETEQKETEDEGKEKNDESSRRSVPEMLLISLNCHENKFNLTTR